MSQSDFVPFRITVCGVEELDAHCASGVTHVLSILDPGAPPPPAFGSFGEHARLDLRFDDMIEEAEGREPPGPKHLDALLAFGRELSAEAETRPCHLLVHCFAGVSRSTASMILILAQARPDRPVEEAFDEVVRIRSQTWPNLRLLEMGDAALGLGGRLVARAHARYREVARNDEERVRIMRSVGRGREVAGL
ncbi:MAG TPA: protein-tyrosine-phosphatase [Azospirillaceae bacterium]|nr:protein-tyrosine-phosphatase [Azospirillaceae bacterium]